jgi:mono/diheme cytochrome c family protein
MRIFNCTFIAVLLVTIVASCSSRVSEPVKQEVFDTRTARERHGEEVFMKHCQKCHPAGEAGLGPAINSNPAPQFVKRFQVRHGLGMMPAFSDEVISKKDLHDLSLYLKRWKTY